MKQFFRAVAAYTFGLHIPELTDANRSRIQEIGIGDNKYLCLSSPNGENETRIYTDGTVIQASDYSDVLGWQCKARHDASSELAIAAYKRVGQWMLENNLAVPGMYYFITDHQNTSGYNTRVLRRLQPNGRAVGDFGL